MLGVAVLAVAAAVAIILASGGGGRSGNAKAGQNTIVGSAARYLNMPASELRSRMRSGETLAHIAESEGHSAQGLLEATLKARTQKIRRKHLPPAQERAELRAARLGVTALLERPRPRHRALLRLAARYLGTTETQLARRLHAEHTLARVADATPGHSSAGLVKYMISRRRRTIERAVSQKILTEKLARKAIAQLRARTERQVKAAASQ